MLLLLRGKENKQTTHLPVSASGNNSKQLLSWTYMKLTFHVKVLAKVLALENPGQDGHQHLQCVVDDVVPTLYWSPLWENITTTSAPLWPQLHPAE